MSTRTSSARDERVRLAEAADEDIHELDAFSRERMLELLVRLAPSGYVIRLFDWLDHVPPDLRDVAVRAFRATETPRVGGVDHDDLVDYVDRIRAELHRLERCVGRSP